MEYEWNKYLEGLLSFKENQGALFVLCIILGIMYWKYKKQRRNVLLIGSMILGVMIVFPLTAMGLLKVYTPFYDWLDLQQIFPILIMIAWFCTELIEKIQYITIPQTAAGRVAKTIFGSVAVVIALAAATMFHGFDSSTEVQENGIPIKTAKIFDALYQEIGEQEIRLAAPDEMLSVSRMYSADWHPVYGRDLWSPKAASYINSGYEKEYNYYDIFSVSGLNEERAEKLTAMINENHTDCIIVPDFWLPYIGAVPEFEIQDLYAGYVGIIKKDLITR